MSLTRWQPFEEIRTLRDTVNRLFDDRPFQSWPAPPTTGTVPLDIADGGDELVVRAVVPGFEPEQIDISVQNDVLTIKGQVETKQEEREENYYLHEYRTESFQRSVRLPAPVDADNAEADYRNGVLTLHLPKSQAAVRKIEVRAGA